MTTPPTAVPTPTPLYRHLVATTLLHCLVVIGALAVDAIAPWVAALVLAGSLAQAAHAAHLRRDVDRGSRTPARSGAGR